MESLIHFGSAMQTDAISTDKKYPNYGRGIHEKSWNIRNLRRALSSIEDIPNVYSWQRGHGAKIGS